MWMALSATTLPPLWCAFVTELNPAGTALVYSTYLGGGEDSGAAIAVDAAGSAYVTGSTGSRDFPTTAGAFQTTLGGGYYVWRSGVGITQGGRVIFVYGPSLNVKELASLLRHAGAVEAMQLDINPEWMSFDYYKAAGHPSNPTPHALLPTQQGSAYRYYSLSSRDFTVVYTR